MTDHQKNLHLLRTYGITLDEWNQMLARYDGACWICRRTHGKADQKLIICCDHWHALANTKIKIIRVEKGIYLAQARISKSTTLASRGTDKKALRKEIRQELKKRSVRGCLCTLCNRSLRVWNDNADRMQAGVDYLRRYKSQLIGLGETNAIS